jgi:hypothetical protein
VSKWGGKKESNSLTILQTSLLLNTFRPNIKIAQLYKNSHECGAPRYRLRMFYQVPGMQIVPRGNSLFVFSSFYNLETLVFVISPSDLNQIGQIFFQRNH